MQQHGEILFGDVCLSIGVRVSSNCSVNQHSFGLLPLPLVKRWQRARGEERWGRVRGKERIALLLYVSPLSLLTFVFLVSFPDWSLSVCPLVFPIILLYLFLNCFVFRFAYFILFYLPLFPVHIVSDMLLNFTTLAQLLNSQIFFLVGDSGNKLGKQHWHNL